MLKRIYLLSCIVVLLFVSLTTVSFATYTEVQKQAKVSINGIKVAEIKNQPTSLFTIKNVSTKESFSNSVTINSGKTLKPVVPTSTDLDKWFDGESTTTDTTNVLIVCFQLQNNTDSSVKISLSDITLTANSSSSQDINAKNCGRVAIYCGYDEYELATLLYNNAYKHGTTSFSTKNEYTSPQKQTLNPDEDFYITVYIWVDYSNADASTSLGAFNLSFSVVGE